MGADSSAKSASMASMRGTGAPPWRSASGSAPGCTGSRSLASNERALACYRACGFRPEGRERDAACVDGQWRDDLILGLLDRELA